MIDDDTPTDAQILEEVIEALMRVPISYGFDGYHINRLRALHSRLPEDQITEL